MQHALEPISTVDRGSNDEIPASPSRLLPLSCVNNRTCISDTTPCIICRPSGTISISSELCRLCSCRQTRSSTCARRLAEQGLRDSVQKFSRARWLGRQRVSWFTDDEIAVDRQGCPAMQPELSLQPVSGSLKAGGIDDAFDKGGFRVPSSHPRRSGNVESTASHR